MGKKRTIVRNSVLSLLLLTTVYAGNRSTATIAHASEQTDDWAAIQSLLNQVSPTITTPPGNVVTSKFTGGQLMGNGDIGVSAGDSVSSQKFYFGKNDFWGRAVKNATEVPAQYTDSILSSGGLTINSPNAGSNPSSVYRMTQDILNAEVRTDMQFGNTTVTMTSWTSDSDDLFVTEFSSPSGSNAVTINADLWMPDQVTIEGVTQDANSTYPYASGISNGVLWTTRENNLNGTTDYKARVAEAAKLFGASFSSTTDGSADAKGSFTLNGGSTVYLAVAIKSGKGISTAAPDMSTVKADAINDVNGLSTTAITTQKSDHRNWWKTFWMKSYVNTNDSTLNQYYYGALYVLGCAIHEGNFPPSLWGSWATQDIMSWGGRYTLNYNAEAPYYGAFSSNRPELVLPYSQVIYNEIPWQENKTHNAGYDGVLFQRNLTPYDLMRTQPSIIPVASTQDWTKAPADQKSNGMFAAIPLIWYWDYTRDTNYLQTKLYPFLKQLDAFYRSYMTWDGTRYVIAHSSAHEGSDDLNPNSDIGYFRKLEKELLDTSLVLGVDSGLRATWQDTLNKLSKYPTNTYNGQTVDLIAENVNGSTSTSVTFEPGNQPINMEGNVFPGEDVYVGGDSSAIQIAKDTLTQMNSWAVDSGHDSYNGFPKIFPIAARVGWPADDLITKFKAAINHQWRASNITVAEGGGGIETSGSIEAINSMLMQSEGGDIRVFPVWPTGKDASFKRLRAKGAFLVSSDLSGGNVSYVDITSEVGGTVHLVNPWSSGTPTITEIDSNGTTLGTVPFALSGGNITFNTSSGKQYHITNGGGVSSGKTYEAESGTLSGSAAAASCSACYGGQKVRFIGNGAANSDTITVNVPSAGIYEMEMDYELSGSRSFFVSVNRGAGNEVALNGTDWSTPTSSTTEVHLNAGNNTIKFYNDSAGAPDLDRIVIVSSGGKKYEAENGTLSGSAASADCSACYGGQKVRYIGNGTANADTITVNVPSAGTYDMEIDYELNGSRSFFVSVNGGTGTEAALSGTDWNTPTSSTIQVNLNAGDNTIKFYNDSASAPDLDRIVIL